MFLAKKNLLIVPVIIFTILSCSPRNFSDTFIPEQINETDKLFTIENIKEKGFRQNKEYDVRELPYALSAYFGWFPDSNNKLRDIEIRFYDSHEDALNYGFNIADEVTGKNAIILKRDVTWKEGNNDRRSNKRSGTGGLGPGSGKAKYGVFVIIGNMIILCEGSETISLDLCGKLINTFLYQ